jgi:hypothetical protein
MGERRMSFSNSAKKVYVDKNKLIENSIVSTLHVENIGDAKQITPDQLQDVFMTRLQSTE